MIPKNMVNVGIFLFFGYVILLTIIYLRVADKENTCCVRFLRRL